MGKGIDFGEVNGSGLRIGIVHTKWNKEFIDTLFERCTDALKESGVAEEDIIVYPVAGSYELPQAAKIMIDQEKVDAVICMGVLIKGSTMHFEYICEAVTQGITRVGLDTGVPTIFGVLTCLSEEQVKERASKDGKDHGYEWGLTAIEMARLKK